MLKETKEFYDRTKLMGKLELGKIEETPVTHTYVFHKAYPRFSAVPLIATTESDLEKLLTRRESVRNFSTEPLGFEAVSKILSSCRLVDTSRNPERRTYPSAGARFPIEIYLISFNIVNLGRGVYHYNIVDSTLEVLWEKDLTDKQEEVVSPFLNNTAAAIVLTSVIARSEVKYGPKAYPFSLIEAGHIGQNIQLSCAENEVGSCSIGGFVNDTLVKILDLTEDEIPLYVIGLGNISK